MNDGNGHDPGSGKNLVETGKRRLQARLANHGMIRRSASSTSAVETAKLKRMNR
jgi:hypothetical protein